MSVKSRVNWVSQPGRSPLTIAKTLLSRAASIFRLVKLDIWGVLSIQTHNIQK